MRSDSHVQIFIKDMNKSKTIKPIKTKGQKIKPTTKKDVISEAIIVDETKLDSSKPDETNDAELLESNLEEDSSLEAMLKKLYETNSTQTVHVHVDEIVDPNQQLNVAPEPENNSTESIATSESDVTNSDNEITNNLDDGIDYSDADNEAKVLVYPIEIENQHQSIIQAALFLAGANGVNIHDLKRVLYQWETNSDYLHGLIKRMNKVCLESPTSGLLIAKFDDRYKLITKPELKTALSKIIRIQLRSALTPSLLEVLAIIAYNNPCTKGMIHKIRQIDPTNSIEKLIRLGLVIRHKRAETPGNPWLYKLTDKFFDLFGIRSVQQLPKVSVMLDENFEHVDESIDFFDVNRPDAMDEDLE